MSLIVRLCHSNNHSSLRVLISKFSALTVTLYSETVCTINFHLLNHIPDQISSIGSMTYLNMFPFERFMRKYKSLHHGTRSLAKQLCSNFLHMQKLWNIDREFSIQCPFLLLTRFLFYIFYYSRYLFKKIPLYHLIKVFLYKFGNITYLTYFQESSKTHCVVGFPEEDNCIEICPKTWLLSETTCLWPNYTLAAKVSRAIFFCETPNQDWRSQRMYIERNNRKYLLSK